MSDFQVEQLLELVKSQSQAIENNNKLVAEMSLKLQTISQQLEELKLASVVKRSVADDENDEEKPKPKPKPKEKVILTEDDDDVTVSGDAGVTFKLKEILKGNGAKWSRSQKLWKFEDVSIDEVKTIIQNGFNVMKIDAKIICK